MKLNFLWLVQTDIYGVNYCKMASVLTFVVDVTGVTFSNHERCQSLVLEMTLFMQYFYTLFPRMINM